MALSKQNNWFLLLSIAITIRLFTSQLGYNYDLESYDIVSELVINGKNVYANTSRYNYGFIWAAILGLLKTTSNLFGFKTIQGFHLLITLFLSLVDANIASLLKKNFSQKVALFFLFNPISILISGYHAQFDNFAILFGLLGWLAFTQQKSILKISLLFGISLTIKHILIFFIPFILFMKYGKNFIQRFQIMFLSISIPVLTSIPFLLTPEAINGFTTNVLQYRSTIYGSWLYALMVKLLAIPLPIVEKNATILFVLFLVLCTFVFVQFRLKHTFYFYCIAIVAFSSSIADQYFAIPLIAVAIFHNSKILKLYSIYIGLFLLLDSKNNIGSLWNYYIGYEFITKWIALFFKASIGQLLLILFLINEIHNIKFRNKNESLSIH